MKQFRNLNELNNYINLHPQNIESVDVHTFTVIYKNSNIRTMSRGIEKKYPAYIIFNDKPSYEEFKLSTELQITFDFHSINTIRASVTLLEFAELRKQYNIELIELYDTTVKTEFHSITVNDMQYSDIPNWGIEHSGLVKAWEKGFTGKGVKVAQIDRSFQELNTISVPATVIRIEGAYDVSGNHGSTCISVIGARLNNKVNVGIAPDCELYALEVGVWDSETYEAYQWCIDNNIDIVSCSFGGSYLGETKDRLLKALHNNGVICVASAGNDNDQPNNYPAKHENVIAVGGVDYQNGIFQKPSFNVVNKPWIDFIYSAKRVAITYIRNGKEVVGYKEGTSFSAPAIAGFIACLKEEFPEWDKEQLVNHMKGFSFMVKDLLGVYPVYYEHKTATEKETVVAKITMGGDLYIRGKIITDKNKIGFSKYGDLTVKSVSLNHSKVTFNIDNSIEVKNIIENTNM